MTPVAFVFPGQGSQFVGMGKGFYDQSPVSKAIFDKAAQIIGQDLLKVIFEGPEETLKLTAYSQPAIFSMSIAALECFKQHPKFQNFSPKFVAGLSLGEYSALAASGALSFEETLALLLKRAAYMEDATKLYKGKMAAIIGLTKEQLQDICAKTGAEIANFNSPQQIVITGLANKVDAACKLCTEAGAKSVIPLAVSGGFHSSLMQIAQDQFQKVLSQVSLGQPQIPIVSNVDAQPTDNPSTIRKNLSLQITSSVQWVDTITNIARNGISTFIEIGPGNVLKGLIRRIDKNLVVHNIEKFEDLETF